MNGHGLKEVIMHGNRHRAYRDQFEYLAECFEVIKKQGDAYNIRSEAQESERMARYSERNGFESERSHLLEIYRGIEDEIAYRLKEIAARKSSTKDRFPFDMLIERHALTDDEAQIMMVLLYNESLGRMQARFQTGNEILNLLFPNPVSALRAARFLDDDATLLKDGLVRRLAEDETGNFLRCNYEVTEKTLHEVLGVSERPAGASDYLSAQSAESDAPYRCIRPQVSWDQLVLAPEVLNSLEDAVWQIQHGDSLMEQWGANALLQKGRGTVLLFGGPPGTGKTLTAEALAGRLGRSLFVADYSQVESKWIGETEKNIVSCFRGATAANAVLLLDEADALLAGRLDGGHYNDRAYNRQVSLLLTELEAFSGVCVLTTNRQVSLDAALARRVNVRLDFPVPGVLERLRLWESIVPRELPLADDVDLMTLAEQFHLPGGNIRNAVLAGVRKAARRDGAKAWVTQADFVSAAAAEATGFDPEVRPIGFNDQELSFSG